MKTVLLSMLGGAIVVLVCWLIQCDRPIVPQPEPPQVNKALDRFPSRHVKGTELLNARTDLRKKVLRRSTGSGAKQLDSVAVLMSVVDLDKKLDSLEGIYGPTLGITFRHGLRTRVAGGTTLYEYYPRIIFTKLSPTVDDLYSSAPIAAAVYAVGSAGDLSPTLGSAWTGDGLYKSHIRIGRVDTTTYGVFEEKRDVESYTLHVDELQQLLDHNKANAVYVKALSIAEPLFIDDGHAWYMRHHVCLLTTKNAATGYEENLDDYAVPDHEPYQRRAMDVGSPCPPRCRKLYLPEKGTEIPTEPWP